jgi:hypothetical protein
MSHLTITLARGSGAAATLKIGDKSPIEFLGWDEGVACYQRAANRVKKLFELGKQQSKNPDLDFFLWEGSNYWIKHDNLIGPILWLFLSEVLVASIVKYEVDTLEIEITDVPEEFLDFCQTKLNLEIKSKVTPINLFKPIILKNFKHSLSTIKLFLKLFIKSIITWQQKTVSADTTKSEQLGRPIMLMSVRGWSNHRYGDLVEKLRQDFTVIGIYPKEYINNRCNQLEDGILSCYQFLTINNIIQSLLKSIKILSIQSQTSKEYLKEDYLAAKLILQDINQLFKVILQYEALQQLLATLSPSAFIVDGSYNSVYFRRCFLACKKAHVKSISIVQKTLFNIASDFDYSNSYRSLPDCFIVHQPSSKELLIQQGVPESKIKVGYRGHAIKSLANRNRLEIQPDLEDSDPGNNFTQDLGQNSNLYLLVLLDIRESINKELLIDILDIIATEGDKLKLLLRQHPSLPIHHQQEILPLIKNLNYQDVSHLSWIDFISERDTITLTPYSTASVEAVMSGSLLIWIPYYSEVTVTSHHLIDSFGKVCHSKIELSNSIEHFLKMGSEERYAELLHQQECLKHQLSLPTGNLTDCTYEFLKGHS